MWFGKVMCMLTRCFTHLANIDVIEKERYVVIEIQRNTKIDWEVEDVDEKTIKLTIRRKRKSEE